MKVHISKSAMDAMSAGIMETYLAMKKSQERWGSYPCVENPSLDYFHFSVDGVPVAKGRARFGKGHAYTPEKTKAYEELVRWEALRKFSRGPMDGPVSVLLEVSLPIPRSWPKQKRKDALMGRVFPTSRPDADNYAKTVLDAINRIAYQDDAQVVSLKVIKRYSERPRVDVTITRYLEAA